jgi:hypothetical protein
MEGYKHHMHRGSLGITNFSKETALSFLFDA